MPVCRLIGDPPPAALTLLVSQVRRVSCLRWNVAAAWHSWLRDTTRCCPEHSLAVWFSVLRARTVAVM